MAMQELHMQSRNQTFEPAFDHLRGMAALLILSFHSFECLLGYMTHGSLYTGADAVVTRNPFLALIVEGHTAVGLFIVMSGFLFTRSALGKDVSYRPFIQNRLLRIYPLYIALIAVILAINQNLTLQSLVMVIIPTGYLPAVQSLGDVGSMFWAVGIEVQFYLIFPFLMRALNDRGIRPLLAIMAFAMLIRLGSPFLGGSVRHVSYWTSVGRIDQFLIGMIAAKIYAEHIAVIKRFRWLFVPSTALVLFAVLEFHKHGGPAAEGEWKAVWPTIEGTVWAIFICTYMPLAKAVPRFFSTPLARIGTVSYSTYLLHVPILLIICANHWYVQVFGTPLYDALFMTVCVTWPIVLAVSALSYYAIEKPFLSMRVKYTTAKPVSASSIDSPLATSGVTPNPVLKA